MTLLELRTLFRSRSKDTIAPYLWADDAIDHFLNEAESEAAERASLIYDDTTAAVTQIAVVAGTKRYALHSSITRIDYAKLGDNPVYVVDQNEYSPRGFFMLPNSTHLEFNFEPQAAETLTLGVYRQPLVRLSLDTDVPEIPEIHHPRLIDWALHLAYLEPDTDTFDQTRADRHEARFIENFGQRTDANVARKQRERRAHVVRCNW